MGNTIKKQSTWLPIFTGFYNSIFDVSELVIESESDICESDFECNFPELVDAGVPVEFYRENFWDFADFSKCFNEAAISICHAITDLDSADILIDSDFESLVSPRYYNFSTDSINCKLTYDVAKLEAYIKENLAEFTEYIKGRYTSCSGFISSYSNDVNDWLDFEDIGEHELGSMLQFVLERENSEPEFDLCEASNVHEDFYNFEFNSEGLIKAYKKSLTNKAV